MSTVSSRCLMGRIIAACCVLLLPVVALPAGLPPTLRSKDWTITFSNPSTHLDDIIRDQKKSEGGHDVRGMTIKAYSELCLVISRDGEPVSRPCADHFPTALPDAQSRDQSSNTYIELVVVIDSTAHTTAIITDFDIIAISDVSAAQASTTSSYTLRFARDPSTRRYCDIGISVVLPWILTGVLGQLLLIAAGGLLMFASRWYKSYRAVEHIMDIPHRPWYDLRIFSALGRVSDVEQLVVMAQERNRQREEVSYLRSASIGSIRSQSNAENENISLLTSTSQDIQSDAITSARTTSSSEGQILIAVMPSGDASFAVPPSDGVQPSELAYVA